MLSACVMQPLRPFDRDTQVLSTRREDLLVEQPVTRVRRERTFVHVALVQGRQDADHDEPAAGAARRRVRLIEALPDLLLKLSERIAGQRPGRHVDLQVELPEFGRPCRIGDRIEHRAFRIDGKRVVVHQVELDLQAHQPRMRLEPGLAQHPREHVQRAPHLVPVSAPILAADGDRGNIPAHMSSAPGVGSQ